MSDGAYDAAFFDAITAGSVRSAEHCFPLILSLIRPVSIVDVGCGRGAFLSVATRLGVSDVLGLDGDYVDRSSLMVPDASFRATDLSRPFTLERTFDLAMSLEVAEHLPLGSSAALVESLCRLAPAIWFSAAIPTQGGTAHINEQWPEFWIKLFAEQGFELFDCLRPEWLRVADIAWWYAQNSLLFIRGDQVRKVFGNRLLQAQRLNLGGAAVIHPALYEARMDALRASWAR